MKIAIIVEGSTEKVLIKHIRLFLKTRKLKNGMPSIRSLTSNGRIPKGEKLKRMVDRLLSNGRNNADYVIALTDVYTGSNDFTNAADAKAKMKKWVGNNNKFFPHAAQYDFEAWLLPFWSTIQKLAGHNKSAPSGNPEQVNHEKPPAHRLHEIFKLGNKYSYVKPRDADRILKENDLLVSAQICPELKSFLNTILKLCDGELIP